ncbi:aminoglycoside phosphotransferase (APT) family kinase protein [Microbacterium resistens]|uniref:Aminoglycoside phosphotransferase (APT) family kinase protein n=1 Tax=Microbacterium resistens TaxID=156977 RepID=A0ABU1S9L9_9MICO|nr:phosphotransferase [Microbacterium resistens]MDR6865522.1 aminoglycoside phosphotransferase (APT) family kinase protein [Microbacterium resistens]
MARSPFTLAAAVTAAVPGAEVVGARALTSDGDARFDSAIATFADGREAAIRVASDDEAAAELAAEELALRALSPGAREILPFLAPEFLGHTRIGQHRALVTSLVPGFQVDAADIPPGRGTAEAAGAAIARIHALPMSVVRSAGLADRSPAQIREEIRALVDRAAATGRVSARLTVRWREAVESDDLWRFESTVTLGGIHDSSFLYEDDEAFGPRVAGIIGWYALSIGDPAVDLAWLASAPEAAADVHRAYAATALRAPDQALRIRSRMLAELEFARWLLHGHETRRDDIVDDAAGLLDALAEGVRNDDLVPRPGPGAGVDEALFALENVPAHAPAEVDTSMQTDAYDPRAFAGLTTDDDTAAFGPRGGGPSAGSEDPNATGPLDVDGVDDIDAPVAPESVPAAAPVPTPGADLAETSDLGDIAVPPARDAHAHAHAPSKDTAAGADTKTAAGADTTDAVPHDASADEAEAQRAARAAFQRWSNSSSE